MCYFSIFESFVLILAYMIKDCDVISDHDFVIYAFESKTMSFVCVHVKFMVRYIYVLCVCVCVL